MNEIMNEKDLCKLPPGWTVEKDDRIEGYNFVDNLGMLVRYSPVDDNAARYIVWRIYNERKMENID
jgi:hypothetical protein